MARGECYECGDEMEVGIYDDPALSGAVVLVCMDCREDTPENCLWDVSALEQANEDWSGEGSHPNLPTDHPLEEDEKWAIQNRYQNEETYLTHLKASWDGKFPDDFKLERGLPDGECWDLFVHDVEDKNAIEEGRAALRERL